MNSVDPARLAPTRQTIQNVCRLLGKLQRLFLGELEHDQQHGLVVTDHGVTTQLMEFGSREWRLTLELPAGNLVAGTNSWPLADNPPVKLQERLEYWLEEQGYKGRIGDPEYSGDQKFDPTAASEIWQIISWGHQQLAMFKSHQPADRTTNLLLYPHHFDEAFSWFYQPGAQYTVGLAPGDEHIAEPYFYVTQYSSDEEFEQRWLPTPGYRHDQGFKAAVLKYNDAARQPEPSVSAQRFLAAATSGS